MVNELPLLCEAGQVSPAVLMTIESSRHLKTGQAFVAEADELDVAHAVNAGARLDRLPDRIVSLSATHPHGGPVRVTSLMLTIWAGRPYYPFDAGSAGA